MSAPTNPTEFDKAYRQPLTLWGDVRIPAQVKALATAAPGGRVLELGCGLGRATRYMARRGLAATGVDFSPVAIARAIARTGADLHPSPTFLVGDVTNLQALGGPFDMAFDIGCFHCLSADDQRAYAGELARLLRPGGILLMWVMDKSPSGLPMSPAAIEGTFAPALALTRVHARRRRLARSHWYWLVRA